MQNLTEARVARVPAWAGRRRQRGDEELQPRTLPLGAGLAVPPRSNTERPGDPAIPLLGVFRGEGTYGHAETLTAASRATAGNTSSALLKNGAATRCLGRGNVGQAWKGRGTDAGVRVRGCTGVRRYGCAGVRRCGCAGVQVRG